MRAWPLVFAVVLVAARASGEDVRRSDVLNEALDEFARGNFDEALALFRREHAARPTARTHRAIFKCLFELRQYTRAVAEADLALASENDPLGPELRKELIELRARALGFTGLVTVRVQSSAPLPTPLQNDVLLIDGKVALWRLNDPNPLRLDAGRHQLTLQMGDDSQTQSVVVNGGGHESVVFSRGATRREAATVSSPLPWLFMGSTLVSAGALTGSVLYFVDRDRANDRCESARAVGADCAEPGAVTRERTLSLVLVPVSAVLLGLSAYALIRTALDRPAAATVRSLLQGRYAF